MTKVESKIKNKSTYFSSLKSIKIRYITLLILGIGIFGCTDTKSDKSTDKVIEPKISINEIYDNKLKKFDKNQVGSLNHYKNISKESDSVFLSELNSKIIPKWEENINIIKELNTIDNLSSEMVDRNKVLLRYSKLRLEAFLLIKKAVTEDTNDYVSQVDELSLQINNEIDKIEKLNLQQKTGK